MKIYVYIDESGSIHKNSNTRYFAVGGYFVDFSDKARVISKYKRRNLAMKQARQLSPTDEIKAIHMNEREKIDIINDIQNLSSFYGCCKVFDKSTMRKPIVSENVFFNYAVKLLFMDCILPRLRQTVNDQNYEFIVSVDSRNIGVGHLKSLEDYLNTEFIMRNYDFKITYYDSKTNYGIQLADLIVNTCYNMYKDKDLVENVKSNMQKKNFIISKFLDR